jgi:glycosyltransferase involved in cell wall biosynthesis
MSDDTQQEKSNEGAIRVLYLNHSGQISGAEQSLRSLLWQMRRERLDVEPTIALPGGGVFSEMLREEGWNVTFAPLRRIERPSGPLGPLSAMTTLMHVLRTAPYIQKLAAKTGAQLIHSNSTTAHLVGALAGERLNIPALWHARDLVSLERIAPALAHRSACVIAISGCVAERLQADGVPPDKIRVIHNGLDPDEWSPKSRSRLRQSLALRDEAFVFGCAGQLVPWKNHVAFIEAAHQLSQDEDCARAHFVIIGGDLWNEHSTYVNELRAMVKKYSLQDRFNFIPHQLDNVDALAALDTLVLPSHDEPFGRVLIEGMALGKPVVAYAENGPIEIVTHGYDGLLVSPDEEDGLAHTMKQTLCDADLRATIEGNARHSVLEKFHIADSTAKFYALYREFAM